MYSGWNPPLVALTAYISPIPAAVDPSGRSSLSQERLSAAFGGGGGAGISKSRSSSAGRWRGPRSKIGSSLILPLNSAVAARDRERRGPAPHARAGPRRRSAVPRHDTPP